MQAEPPIKICTSKHFLDAWIQAGRFAGKNKQQIKDTQEIRNYPTLAVEEAMDFVQKHSMISLEIDRYTTQKNGTFHKLQFEKRSKIGLSIRATHARLAMLIKRGLVVVIGTSTKDPKRKYFLAK